ncbi:MAG: LacI family DNA-binding transcriptional regulator [Verrucomicrobia bacterium]|nr:LacI family DNA-binding transcriptional regulator [Verrucomicrobiota bacterium]
MTATTTTLIGRRAGVSHATVCDVLNGRWQAKRISQATCARVRTIARKLNYRPNRVARSLLTGRTHTVALVIPSISRSFFPSIVLGVETEAKQHGYHVLLSHVIAGLEDEVPEIEALLERRVDGLIIVPRHGAHNRENYRQLLKEGFPLVFVNDWFEDVPVSAVVGDDFNGARQATEHLIALGHRRIAFLAGNPGPTVSQWRTDGYHRALKEHGLAAPKNYIQGFAYTVAHGYAGMQRLLKLSEPPTAVLGGNDAAALGGIKAALEAGLRVPEDIAFVGYGDDLEEVWFQKIPLTTMRLDATEMGRRAMALLVEEMGGPPACGRDAQAGADRRKKKTMEKLSAKLVVRESCGAKVTTQVHGSAVGKT